MLQLIRQGALKLRQVARRFGMPRRWLLTYMLLIVLPASILLYAYYQRSATVLEDEVSDSMLQTVKQAGINLSYRLGHVQEISNILSMNQKLYQYLQEEESSTIAKQLEVLKELRYLVDTMQLNTDVFRIRLFVKNTSLFSEERVNFFSLDTLKNWSYYNKVLQANGASVWTAIYRQYYIDRDFVPILSNARVLHDSNQFDQVSGILVVDMPEKLVMDILTDLHLSKQNNVYVVDAEGLVVAHADKSRIGMPMPEELISTVRGGTEGKLNIELSGQSEYVMYSTIQPTGWKVVAQVPASEFSEKVKLNQIAGIATLIAIFALFLVLVFALLALIVRSMNRRVQQVIRVIRKEGIDRLDEPHPMPEGDFLMLERSVDVLIHRVRSLMEQTYKAQVLEREAQLRALQAQINPHFLYNTLDTINWLAIGHGMQDISQMIDSLAKYFRLSLNKGRDMMSVADELNLAQVYLDLQKSRFLHTFDYVIEPDPEVLNYIVPKLTLQPIVENALLHGIRKMKHKLGLIRVTARREGDELLLIVSDDGIGMEAERAQRLLIEPPPVDRKDGVGSSYGLYNVNERIKLFAGEASGLSIESRPGEGTTVTVRIRLKAHMENAG
ncbi:sensor histidine kinase [Paenibacillus sp. HJGM_3]|uniref:sensor histidine kinase n=1 Tax=Paenibacillus sp. HJGM_3 TaxID=3379816 RepID=UPI00385A01BF